MSEVASVAIDTREGRTTVLAGVKSWHWGPTVQASTDGGRTWTESAERALSFPADTDTALERVWQLTPDPNDADVVWAGVEPHALFRSADAGESYELVRGLWDHPHRPKWEPGFGGGAVHTIVPEPGHPEQLLVAMSAGGVYRSADAGQTWEPSNPGIRAYFMPHDEYPEFGQCVHKVARGQGEGELFAQNHKGVYRSGDNGAHLGLDRRWAPHRLRFHHPRPPARAGRRLERAGRRRRGAHPAGRPAAGAALRRRRSDVAPAGSRPAGRELHVRAARRRRRRRR